MSFMSFFVVESPFFTECINLSCYEYVLNLIRGKLEERKEILNMKAIVITEAGSVDNFIEQEVDKPTINNDEVLIKVKAAALNPIDTQFRLGNIPVKDGYPAILLSDLSGEIAEIGSNVDEFFVGDPVFTRNDMDIGGGLGEFVTVKASDVVHKPDAVSFEDASTLGIAALTAYQAVNDYAELTEGDKVFMNGASGGVGHFALQFAKVNGAEVTATTSSHPTLLEELGADHIINYKEEDATETHPKEYDILIDFAGNGTEMLGVVKDGGYATTPAGKIDKDKANERDIQSKRVGHKLNTEEMAKFADLITAGQLRVVIDKTYPMTVAGIQDAFKALEEGHVGGKVVVSVDA